MRVRRLDHFGIEVSDLDRAEAFYTGVLGLEVHRRFGHFIELQGHNCMLALFRNPGMHPMGGGDVRDPFGKGHWAFEVTPKELREGLERFSRDGIPHRGPVDWGDHDCLYFLDPDGNLLEIVAYRDGASRKEE